MGLLSNLFRTSSPADRLGESWWQRAGESALNPHAQTIDELRASLASAGSDADERERREEMIEGLARVLVLRTRADLPHIDSQHRVIGSDRCHFAVPADLAGDHDTPGKVFLTSRRLVFAGASVRSWPWHRIRDVVRLERDLLATISDAEIVRLRFTSYGDTLEARFLAQRLMTFAP